MGSFGRSLSLTESSKAARPAANCPPAPSVLGSGYKSSSFERGLGCMWQLQEAPFDSGVPPEQRAHTEHHSTLLFTNARFQHPHKKIQAPESLVIVQYKHLWPLQVPLKPIRGCEAARQLVTPSKHIPTAAASLAARPALPGPAIAPGSSAPSPRHELGPLPQS